MPHSHEDDSHERREMMKNGHQHGKHYDDDHKKSFWSGCSEKFWGDEDHEHEAKKIAFISVIVLIVVLVVVVTIIVICCRRKKKAAEAAKRRQGVKQAVVSPAEAVHPKAIEAFGPTGVPQPVVVCVPEAPACDDEEKKDPRLVLGVWSPPPAYEVKEN